MTDETLKAEKNQGEGFQPPFPGPLFPPTAGKVLIWRGAAESPDGDEFEDLMLWRTPSGLAHRFRGAAAARGLTPAQHLSALVTLHETMRQRADGGDADIAAMLDQLGLNSVAI